MKWKTPEPLDERTKGGFLFFPKEINHEVRWLEKAMWKQVYKRGTFYDYWWTNYEWDDSWKK